MTIGMPTTTFLAPRRPRPGGSLLDAADVEHHERDDLRWVAGVETFGFDVDTYVGDLIACDVPASADPDFGGTELVEGSRSAFVSLVSMSCGTLSGSEVLTRMRGAIALEHQALLPHHLDEELINGSISGNTAQSLSALATDETSSDTTPELALEAAEGIVADDLNGVLSYILVPLNYFQTAAANAVFVNGVWHTRAGNIVVPHTAVTGATGAQDVYVVPAPLRIHLSPANVQFPEEWVERPTNKAVVTSEIVALFEFAEADTYRFTIDRD